jgi:hypothetical protein
MGTITRSFANNITTSGVLLPASLTNNSIANVTAYNVAIATGNMVLLSSQTASGSSSLSFTTGINSTYKEYQFWFINIKPNTTDADLLFNMSTDSGSNYNVTKTTTSFFAYNYENDTASGLLFDSGKSLDQSTAFVQITNDLGSDSDGSASGYMSLFNPASTTYVKHFICTTSEYYRPNTEPRANVNYNSGYGNTTSAVNAVRFQMTTGNFDGTILMYGIV